MNPLFQLKAIIPAELRKMPVMLSGILLRYLLVFIHHVLLHHCLGLPFGMDAFILVYIDVYVYNLFIDP